MTLKNFLIWFCYYLRIVRSYDFYLKCFSTYFIFFQIFWSFCFKFFILYISILQICKTLHRQPKHLLDFLLAELGTSGSVDGNSQLIIKGRFQQKQIENVLRRYIKEYVTCHTCRSPDTILQKDTRLFFLQCETCGSRCSVASIKSGFQVNYSLIRNNIFFIRIVILMYIHVLARYIVCIKCNYILNIIFFMSISGCHRKTCCYSCENCLSNSLSKKMLMQIEHYKL